MARWKGNFWSSWDALQIASKASERDTMPRSNFKIYNARISTGAINKFRYPSRCFWKPETGRWLYQEDWKLYPIEIDYPRFHWDIRNRWSWEDQEGIQTYEKSSILKYECYNKKTHPQRKMHIWETLKDGWWRRETLEYNIY